mmetsp:Transcript_18952/g.64266  ORF Transcript_18952/g.64266 Transcript_18952/m.64266 type:complete len:307 (+) Transcript_18952:207-1127(+)
MYLRMSAAFSRFHLSSSRSTRSDTSSKSALALSLDSCARSAACRALSALSSLPGVCEMRWCAACLASRSARALWYAALRSARRWRATLTAPIMRVYSCSGSSNWVASFSACSAAATDIWSALRPSCASAPPSESASVCPSSVKAMPNSKSALATSRLRFTSMAVCLTTFCICASRFCMNCASSSKRASTGDWASSRAAPPPAESDDTAPSIHCMNLVPPCCLRWLRASSFAAARPSSVASRKLRNTGEGQRSACIATRFRKRSSARRRASMNSVLKRRTTFFSGSGGTMAPGKAYSSSPCSQRKSE